MNDNTVTIIVPATEVRVNDATSETIALEETTSDLARAKLADALTPGYQAEFDPAEAEAAGAFPEDALTEDDALDSTHDYPHFTPVSFPMKS